MKLAYFLKNMSKKNQPKTWKVYHRKIVFKCSWFQIIEEDLRKPNGFRSKYYVFESLSKRDFIMVIALDNDYFYMTKQWRPTLKRETVEFVAGGVGKNEIYLEAAKRELLEEAGLKAKKWHFIGKAPVAPGHSREYGRIFLAENISFSKEKAAGEPGEGTELVKIPRHKFKRMIYQREIDDGPTLSAYLLYLTWSKKL